MKILKTAVITLTIFTTITLGQAWVSRQQQSVNHADLLCLAQNIYHEARGEPLEGQLAVAHVTLNRVRSGKFQNTVCAVVFARRQFSWTNSRAARVRDTKAWKTSVSIAREVLVQPAKLLPINAHFFHTKAIRPAWAKHKQVVAVIGNHIFYN